MSSGNELPPVPAGLQRLLLAAQRDSEALARLLTDRDAAASALGVSLTASEAAMLRAIPEAQLMAMVANLPPPPPAPPLVTRPAHDFPAPGGCAADLVPPRPDHREMETEGGCAPHPPPERPVHHEVRMGITADLDEDGKPRSWLKRLFGKRQ